MAEGREPGDVGRVGLIPVGDGVVEGGLDVDGLSQHDDVDHEAQGAQLVLLTGLIVLAQLAPGAVEHVPGQALAALAPAEDAVDGRLEGFGPLCRDRRIAEGVTVRASREAVRRQILSHWLMMSPVLARLRARP